MSEHEHDEEGYTGAATLVFGEEEVAVEVDLRGYFQPIDGRYHWYGRVKASDEVTSRVEGGARTAVLRTPTGQAEGTLTDQDPWGRYRVAGTSTPPYRIDEPVDH
ncbi:DUF4873 domain-containing protein [Nocardia sp. NRRL S-836]|uniref:DUF4873 domain-containing protein n=1 Tax=Nocardia sp. NRRL S-836 TaxID=1519492 RepID=UPI0006AEE410|nr:DUF4873 domain-containing protein [Nocardia sp. NRRL S-836]KOV76942.1 hypothetical protein ADL03_42735 [Nocardia sp. NRRL S-836]